MNLFINFFTHSPLAQAVGLYSASLICFLLMKKQMNMTTSLRIIRLFVMIWQSLKKNRRIQNILCEIQFCFESISGTSNPEYIVGSISDSQVRLY
ncbi:hypothetical protein T05_1865 [Trichinella murrelli]|uniref:Uncharacterized protein n=1 Tax=Trichinella murrelli TaxID=144512 RepID=A0A0V0U9R7_9BILA|nr:hypothetical protein T05_1865 [Trichinella murrelli]